MHTATHTHTSARQTNQPVGVAGQLYDLVSEVNQLGETADQVDHHKRILQNCHIKHNDILLLNTLKPVLAVTSIKQPTCLKQPNKMFSNVKFVLIFTSVEQPPALSSHFLCFPCVAA